MSEGAVTRDERERGKGRLNVVMHLRDAIYDSDKRLECQADACERKR